MDNVALAAMQTMLKRTPPDARLLLDVGSMNVNGTYRETVETMGLSYTGLDIEAGPNVDVVTADPYSFPFADNSYDVVISGSTMEHVREVWRWVPELVRVLRPGGLLAIVTHTSWPEHRWPVDCWRVMVDGMALLFDLTDRLSDYDIGYLKDDSGQFKPYETGKRGTTHIAGSAIKCAF